MGISAFVLYIMFLCKISLEEKRFLFVCYYLFFAKAAGLKTFKFPFISKWPSTAVLVPGGGRLQQWGLDRPAAALLLSGRKMGRGGMRK